MRAAARPGCYTARLAQRVVPRAGGMRTALLWLLATAMTPCALAAQRGPGDAGQDWEQYETAREAYNTALAARDALRVAQQDLINQRNLAVRQGDDERADLLSAEFQERAEELDRADAELRRLEEQWVAAGEALIDRIDTTLDELARQLDESPADPRQAQLVTQLEERFDSLTSLRDSVDTEIPRVPLEVPTMPNIEARRGDGPAERLRKANIYRDYAQVCQRRIEEANKRIEELDKVRRLNEARDASSRRSDIFRSTVPVGQAGGGSGRTPGDSAVTDLSRQTLAERIEELEELINQLEARQAEAQARADEILGPPGGRR